MGQHARKNIITEGLVFETDAANKLCKLDSDTVGLYATNFTQLNVLETSTNAIFNFGDTDFTLVCWVRRNVGTGLQFPFAKAAAAGAACYGLATQSTQWEWRVSNNGAAGGRTLLSAGLGSMVLGQWQHVACVNDSTNNELRFYVDGVEFTAAHAGGSLAELIFPFTVGVLRYNTPNPFSDGDVDKLSIYNKAFVQADATTSFNGGVSLKYADIDTVNLLSHYSLDEGNGSNRIDSHGSNDLIETGTGVDNASESALVAVDLVSQNNGTPINGIDILQNVWTFDGVDDVIEFGAVPALEFNRDDDFSIEFTIKLADVGSNNSSVWSYYSGGTGLWFYPNNLNAGITMSFGTAGDRDIVGFFATPDQHLDTAIHSFTHNGSTREMKYYRNGVFQTSFTMTFVNLINYGAAELLVGSNTIHFMEGEIHSLKAYAKELTLSEVENNYSAIKQRL